MIVQGDCCGSALYYRSPTGYGSLAWARDRFGTDMLSTNFKAGQFVLALLSGAFFTIAGLTMADAADRRVRILNETSFDIVRFYGSNVGSDDWEEDILGRDVLRAGKSVMINFDDGTGYCIFDFKAVFDDGDEVIKERVNICKIGSFRFTE